MYDHRVQTHLSLKARLISSLFSIQNVKFTFSFNQLFLFRLTNIYFFKSQTILERWF
nr:MAG TPA: hypothetical protein [Caudoviricetes sp.]